MDFRFDGHVSNAGDEDSKDNFLPGWSALSQAGLEGMHELIMVKMLQDGLGHCVNPSSPHRSSNKCVELNQCRKRFRPHIVPNDKELKLLDGIILQNRMLDGTAESDHVKHLPAATQPMCQDHCRKLLSYARELESKVALLSEFKNRNEMLEKSIEESKLRELRMAEQVTALSTSKSHLETQVDKLMQCKQECDQYRIRNDELTVVCHRHSQIIKQILYDKEQLRQQQRAIGEKLCIGKPDLDVQVLEMKRALDELALGHTQILEKQRLAKVEAKALTQNEYDQKLQGLMNIYESQLDQLKDQLKDVSEYRTEIDSLRTELRNKGNQHKEAVLCLVAVQSKRRFLSRGFQAWKAMLHKAALFALNEVVARRCSLLFSNRRFRYQVQLVFRAWQSLYLSTKRTRRLMMACMRCLRLQTLRVCLKQWMRATRYVHMQGKVLIALMQTAKQKRFFRAFSQWKSSTKSEKTLHFQELCVARKCKSLYARRSCRRGLKCFQTWRDLNRREKARRAAMRRCIVRIKTRLIHIAFRTWSFSMMHQRLRNTTMRAVLLRMKRTLSCRAMSALKTQGDGETCFALYGTRSRASLTSHRRWRYLKHRFVAWYQYLISIKHDRKILKLCLHQSNHRRVQLVFRAWQSLYLSTKRTRRLMMACMRCLRLQTLRVCLKQWMRATRYVHMQGKVLIALMQTAKQKRFFRAFSQWKSSTKSEKTLHFQELCVARKCKSLYARRSCRRGLKCFQTWRDLNRREKARRAAMRRCIVRIIKRRLGKSWRQWRRTLWHEKLKDQAVWSLLWSKKKRTVYSSFRHWWTIIKFMKVSRFQRKIVAQLVSFKQKAKKQILLKSWKWCTDVEATKYKMARFLMELRKQKTLSHSFSRWRLRLCKESLSLFRELTLSRAQFRLRNTNMSRAKRMVFGSWKLFFCFRKTLSIKCRRMCFCLRMLGLRRSFSTWFSFSEYWRHTLRAAQYFQSVSRRIQQTGAFQKWVLFLRRRWMEEKQGLQELSVTTSRRFRAASLIFFFTQRFWQRKMNAVLNTMNRCVQECRHQRDFLRYNLCCLLQRKLVRTRSLAFRKWKWAARRMVKHKFPIYQVSTPKPRPIKWR